ncbi:MAG TPA: SpoIID/LytB domain-containing protein, partial [Longimicrobiales bacterium]
MKRYRATIGSMAVCVLLSACIDSDPAGVQMLPHAQQATVPATFTGNIRIGVVPSAASVTIGSAGDYTIVEKTSGLPLLTGSNGSAVISIETAGSSRYRLQVMCASTATVTARKAAAEALGYVTFTEFVPAANCTRLFLGDFAEVGTFTPRVAFKNKAIADGVAASDAFWKLVAVSVGTYRVTRGSAYVVTTQPPVLTSSTGLVTINGLTYRGSAEVRTNSASLLAGVNELPLEQYLYGVVPRELGPIAYPEVEAQKAQAIAARTYALSGIGKRASDGYDLLATTSDQVYGGYSAEHPVSNAAVDATHGIVLTYEGNLISALYSSASGGYTADNEEAFDGAPAPYLRGIPDAERGEAEAHVPSLDVFKMHANPNSLRNAKESDFESDWSRYHRWTYEWSMQDMADVVSALAKTTVTQVSAIN